MYMDMEGDNKIAFRTSNIILMLQCNILTVVVLLLSHGNSADVILYFTWDYYTAAHSFEWCGQWLIVSIHHIPLTSLLYVKLQVTEATMASTCYPTT